MHERVKLVGGFAAGKTKLIEPGSEKLRIMLPPPRLPLLAAGTSPVAATSRAVTYRRLRLNADQARLAVFIPEEWSDAEGLIELIDGYLE